jgi:hypothetical protein
MPRWRAMLRCGIDKCRKKRHLPAHSSRTGSVNGGKPAQPRLGQSNRASLSRGSFMGAFAHHPLHVPALPALARCRIYCEFLT